MVAYGDQQAQSLMTYAQIDLDLVSVLESKYLSYVTER